MRVIVAGAGRAGLSVARHLGASGHDVTLIDRDQVACHRAFEDFGLATRVGDATDAVFLREAGAIQANVVVSMLRRDADNLAVALLARSLGAERVMVRMRDPAYREVYESAGVNRILNETDVFVAVFATAIEHEAVRHAMVLGGGMWVAVELSVEDGSRLSGKAVVDVASDPEFPRSCVFAGLYGSDGTIEAPRGASVLVPGIVALVVVKRDDLSAAVRFFTASVS